MIGVTGVIILFSGVTCFKYSQTLQADRGKVTYISPFRGLWFRGLVECRGWILGAHKNN